MIEKDRHQIEELSLQLQSVLRQAQSNTTVRPPPVTPQSDPNRASSSTAIPERQERGASAAGPSQGGPFMSPEGPQRAIDAAVAASLKKMALPGIPIPTSYKKPYSAHHDEMAFPQGDHHPKFTTVCALSFLHGVKYEFKRLKTLHGRSIARSVMDFGLRQRPLHLSIYISTLFDLLSYIPHLLSPCGFDVGKRSDHCTSIEIGSLYVVNILIERPKSVDRRERRDNLRKDYMRSDALSGITHGLIVR